MVDAFRAPLTAAAIKDKARALGADLVGIADGAAFDADPPPVGGSMKLADITDHDAGRVIVLAKRYNRRHPRASSAGTTATNTTMTS